MSINLAENLEKKKKLGSLFGVIIPKKECIPKRYPQQLCSTFHNQGWALLSFSLWAPAPPDPPVLSVLLWGRAGSRAVPAELGA